MNMKHTLAVIVAVVFALCGAATGVAHAQEARLPSVDLNFPAEPGVTLGQQNAVRSAEDYLGFAAFSREGLIEQLEFDGFSTADATFAVDSITVDWNEQAALSAQTYLDFTSFSRSGLIEQLQFDGFTAAQAAYGATAVGY